MSVYGFNWDAPWQEQSVNPDTPATGQWKLLPKSAGFGQLDDAGTFTFFTTGGSTPTFDYLTLTEHAKPSTPTNAIVLYADTSNDLAWVNESGWSAALRTSGLSADRVFTLPNFDGTLATLAGTETLSNKTLTAPIVAILKPVSDTSTAIQIMKSDGVTQVAVFDTQSVSFGVGSTATPTAAIWATPINTATSGAPLAGTFIMEHNPSGNSSATVIGFSSGAKITTANVRDLSGSLRGANVTTTHGGTGTVAQSWAGLFQNNNTSTGTITAATTVEVLNTANSGGGAITTNVGIKIADQTNGTNKTNLLIGTVTTGDWGIYSTSSKNSSHLGKLGLGGNFTPTNTLSLTGQSAQTAWMERHTTADTAGNILTLQSGGATSGATNKAAGALVLATGLNTGNAVPALIQMQDGAASDTSGTGNQTQVNRFIPNGFKVLTDNSAITILNATLAAGTTIGGVIDYTITVWNGTDYQVETGRVYYSGGNKGGAFSVTVTEVNSQQNASSGTLTTTWAISSANPAAISVNADSSLTPNTGYPRIRYSVHNFAEQALAVA